MGLRWTPGQRAHIDDHRFDPPIRRDLVDAVDGRGPTMSRLKVLGTVRPRSHVIQAALINTALDMGLTKDMVITVGANGTHKVGSLHGSGNALDIRTKHLTRSETLALIEHMGRRLGPAYQLMLEDRGTPNEHLHAEYDP